MHSTRSAISVTVALSCLLLGACTIGEVSPTADRTAVTNSTPAEKSATETNSPSPTLGASTKPHEPKTTKEIGGDTLSSLPGKTIYLDPGHAGTAPPPEMTAIDGRGGTKSCNTTGTESGTGWPEHEFTWAIASQLKSVLESSGAEVIMSRTKDGRADCIDERTYKENSSTADVVVSLHADGSSAGNTGFHISSIAEPLPDNKKRESSELASHIRDAMSTAGLESSNYLGESGLYPRSDLAGLNLSSKPKVLIEFGNMRDASDLAGLQSVNGRQERAEAVAVGIADYLA